MSSARFDVGQVQFWQPIGVYHATQNCASGPTVLCNLNPVASVFYRIDWASVIISYSSALDLNDYADLSIGDPGDGNQPFLTVSANPLTDWVPLTARKRWMEQLSLPFYVTANSNVKLYSASTAGTSASTCEATVAVSRSWAV